jgi:uncharacterized phage infection (PIP) family protein YhgE
MQSKLVRMLVVVFSVALLSSCGGGGDGDGGSVSPSVYLTALCRELGDWTQAAQNRLSQLQGQVQATATVDERKDILRNYIDGLIADTQELIDGVRTVGFPDVPGGAQTANAFVTAFEQAKSSLEEGRQRIDDLPEDPQGFSQAADQLGNNLQTELSSIGDSVSGLGGQDELKSAFAETPQCQDIQS